MMPNFWDIHGLWFLLGCAFFPRITVWFFSAVTGGFWFWLGFLLVPRIYVAIIACYWFWETNPVLCVLAVVMCLGGESTEKSTVAKSASKQ